MSLIEKIDAEIAMYQQRVNNRQGENYHDESERLLRFEERLHEAERIKELILSEQKEPCGWCKENYRFEYNWIDEDGNTVTTDNHMVIGGIADYCPVCGRPLNQPYTDGKQN